MKEKNYNSKVLEEFDEKFPQTDEMGRIKEFKQFISQALDRQKEELCNKYEKMNKDKRAEFFKKINKLTNS